MYHCTYFLGRVKSRNIQQDDLYMNYVELYSIQFICSLKAG